MHRIPCKPLSVNQAWQGRRFMSNAYKTFKKAVYALLNRIPQPVNLGNRLFAHYQWGQSNPRTDTDNPCKPFQDVLFENWGIKGDHVIDLLILQKVIVTKKSEFIGFHVDNYDSVVQYLRDLADEIESREGK